MLGAALSSGLDAVRRLSFGSTPTTKPYFEAEDPSSPFPNVFINSVVFLERHGLTEEGILRVTGRLSDVTKVRGLLAEGKTSELKEADVHTVASVLKSFFNDSPQSILPEDQYTSLLKLTQNDNEDLGEHLRKLIIGLPENHQKILHRLLMLVDRIQQNSKVNKMEGTALSVVLGPLLLRSAVPLTPAQHFADNAACVKLASALVEEQTRIFEGIGLNALNVREIDDSLKGKTYAEGIRTATSTSTGSHRSFKFNRPQGETGVGSLRSATFSGPNDTTRTYYEKAVEETRLVYEKARQSRERMLNDAKDTVVREWQTLKKKADEQDILFKLVQRKYHAKQEQVDTTKILKEEATHELERLKAFYQVTSEKTWEAVSVLRPDEIAHLQEAQALHEWREAEYQLAAYDLQAITEEKALVETPHEIAQQALWAASQELQRLEISEEQAEKWVFSA